MSKGKISKKLIGFLLAVILTVVTVFGPLQIVFAYDADGAQAVTRGGYYDLPETVKKYASSGKTLEFDLNILIKSSDVCKLALFDGTTTVSPDFMLKDGDNGIKLDVKPLKDGWYHYTVSFASIPHSAEQGNSQVTRFRVKSTFPAAEGGTKINNISIGVDVYSLPETFDDDYDTVTLADLGLAGTDYKTPVYSDTYNYDGKSKTKSVIVKFGWDAKVTEGNDWKIALDTFWNANCMVWFLPNLIYFCPGQGDFHGLVAQAPPVTSGRHEVEFGRLRVATGPNCGKDFVFIKIDGDIKAFQYTDYYQTEGGYAAYNDTIVSPSYTVCLVGEGVVAQRFSGFAMPDEFVSDVDVINVGDVAPGGVINEKSTGTEPQMANHYIFKSTSETKSTVARFVVKTGKFTGALDTSQMAFDIGGNSGFCRSYIIPGNHDTLMFGWEVDGCVIPTIKYKFESNSWYAFEQGRKRITTGKSAGKDYVYLKINGEDVSSFIGEPDSHPFLWNYFYVEVSGNMEICGYNELSAKFYVDDELYKDQFAQKGFTVAEPENPTKEGEYFVGWYTAKTGGKLFDFKNTKLSDNISLYARFTKESVKATFDPKNGSAKSNATLGKGCLVKEPATPSYSDGKYEYTFVGWKNETTGKIFDFETDRISADTLFTAQYKEKEYFVSYYADGKLVKKVPFVLSNPTVAGKEPSVPAIPNATGVWESHKTTGLTKNITVNATYNAKKPTASSAIGLTKYSGGKIYINTDTVHNYLSTKGAENQTAFINKYCVNTYEFQDHQNTSFKWTDSGKNSKYTVYFADNNDFKNAYIVTTSSKSLVNKVGIFTPGKTYYWYVRGNDTGKCSAVDTFKVVNTPVRYITAGKVTNMRDEGGYMTTEGNKVKYGLVYRGAALDEMHSNLDDAARKVFTYLGIKTEIELRGEVKHDYTGFDENNSNVFCINGHGYEQMLTIDDSVKADYKAVFEALADQSNYPVYFHCSAGADRTGSFAYLLNGLLGVPYEDLRKDYELTSFSEVGARQADNNPNGSFDTMNRLILEQYGDKTGNLQTAIQNYLTKFIGISPSTLEAIKDIMLDKSPAANDKPYTINVDVLGKKYTYQAFDGVYFMPETPESAGKIFKGFYNGSTKYNGYAKGNLNLTAKFEDIQYEPYDTISLKDLGVFEKNYPSPSNTVLTYNKTAKSGGRLFKFILVPNKDMNDGLQVALTNNWNVNGYARIWFQNNKMSFGYYKGIVNGSPDIIIDLPLEAGKEYNIEYAVRVMKNKGYEGKKIFEVNVNGKSIVRYIGCKADLSENMIYLHGGYGAATLRNQPIYKTVKFYSGNTLLGTYKVERSCLLPKVKEPAPKNGLPFAGWYTKKTGGTLWDENADLVYDNMCLYAHFANVRTVTANVDGKIFTYRVEVGKTLSELPKPQKPGYVFTGWLLNGKPFTGKVTSKMNVTASFEAYSFDDYDEISLRDLGIYRDLDFAMLGDLHMADYTYCKAAETGGRVFKAIYVPTENMINGPQVSFSPQWNENYFAKLYFTKYDEFYIYSSGIVDGLPTFTKKYDLVGGKEYLFEIGVRVLNNKGYKGVKVFTVYMNGELIFEEFDNKFNLDGASVFFQGAGGTGIFKNVDIYKTVSFYDGDKLLSSVKVLRGKTVKSIGSLGNKGDKLFMGWFTERGFEWNFGIDCVYLDTVLKAKYQKKTYAVTLMVDNVLYKRINVFAGECADISDMPVKDGYDFDKWLNEDGSIYDIATPVNSPITLLASFKKQTAKIGSDNGNENPSENGETKQSVLICILFSLLGLAVISGETGVIIHKKRSK